MFKWKSKIPCGLNILVSKRIALLMTRRDTHFVEKKSVSNRNSINLVDLVGLDIMG